MIGTPDLIICLAFFFILKKCKKKYEVIDSLVNSKPIYIFKPSVYTCTSCSDLHVKLYRTLY